MSTTEIIPDLEVAPNHMTTVRYAGASGDFNPIHVDDAFARSVGLPRTILHGLWTMAQVARCLTEHANDPTALRALSVQFRGMGFPEQELVISATIRDATGSSATVDVRGDQGGRMIIGEGVAELRVGTDD